MPLPSPPPALLSLIQAHTRKQFYLPSILTMLNTVGCQVAAVLLKLTHKGEQAMQYAQDEKDAAIGQLGADCCSQAARVVRRLHA